MSHFCTAANSFKQVDEYTSSKVVHGYAGFLCQLLCIACILYSTEPRCFWVQTDFQRLRQNYEELHKVALMVLDLTLTHANAHARTHTFLQAHTHTNISPLCRSKKLNKK